MDPTKGYAENSRYLLEKASESLDLSDNFVSLSRLTQFKECDEFMKKLSYHTIEYGVNIEKLTIQFTSKLSSVSKVNRGFDKAIADILGKVKDSLVELAQRIKERINQYYAATNATHNSSARERVHDCRRLLDEIDKMRAVRDALRLKVQSSTKDVMSAEKRLTELRDSKAIDKDIKKQEEKVLDLKRKREKEYKSKYDDIINDYHNKMQKFATQFKDCLNYTKQYEASRNGVVVLGFDKLGVLYSEWAQKCSKITFESVSETIGAFSLMDRDLEGLPTSWIVRSVQEPTFEGYIKSLEVNKQIQNAASQKLEEELTETLATYRCSLSRSDTMRADLYSMHLINQNLTESEEATLTNDVSMKMRDESFLGYFTHLLHYILHTPGRNQLKVTQRQFISLKNMFLVALINIEIGDLKMNNVGILIYNAARIYFESSGGSSAEVVPLIQHLDCNMLRKPIVWEHYFLFRINSKIIHQGQTGRLGCLMPDAIREIMSPIRKVGNSGFVFSEGRKQTLKFIQEHPDQVRTTFKEIVYYLTMVEGLAPKARNILVRIFKRFEIEESIVKHALFLEMRYNEAYLHSKIQTVQKPSLTIASDRPSILAKCLRLSAKFLEVGEATTLLNLSKEISQHLREPLFKELLARPNLSFELRRQLYVLIIPRRYKPEEFLMDKADLPIHPSCAKVIKLDLDRTCRTRPELYKASELLLFNYLYRNDTKMAYFQGLNFIATHIVRTLPRPIDQLNCIDYTITNMFGLFVNSKLFKDGLGILIMFYCLDRLFELMNKRMYSHMQREGIGVQLFAANPVITVFTWNSELEVVNSALMNLVWDSIILCPSVSSLFKIIMCLAKLFEDYMLLCDMEEFIVTWDAFLGSKPVWSFDLFDKEYLSNRILPQKLETLDVQAISRGMHQIRAKMEEVNITDELVNVLYEEYYTVNQSMDAINKEVNQQLLKESEMYLSEN